MTQVGGINNQGCVFSLDTNGTGYTDLLDFNNSNGAQPGGALNLLGNTLYGMTVLGGTNGGGIIFSMDTNGNNYTDIHNFGGLLGSEPYGSLLLSGNSAYGLTYSGGANNDGTIFSLNYKTTGINELAGTSMLTKLFPNPNNGKFNIVIAGEAKQSLFNIEIYNVLGEKIYSSGPVIRNSQFVINLSNQTSGIYFYKLFTIYSSVIETGKFIIE
jgi:uncharacterized repeat protein (TIGR03803 family)